MIKKIEDRIPTFRLISTSLNKQLNDIGCDFRLINTHEGLHITFFCLWGLGGGGKTEETQTG